MIITDRDIKFAVESQIKSQKLGPLLMGRKINYLFKSDTLNGEGVCGLFGYTLAIHRGDGSDLGFYVDVAFETPVPGHFFRMNNIKVLYGIPVEGSEPQDFEMLLQYEHADEILWTMSDNQPAPKPDKSARPSHLKIVK